MKIFAIHVIIIVSLTICCVILTLRNDWFYLALNIVWLTSAVINAGIEEKNQEVKEMLRRLIEKEKEQ